MKQCGRDTIREGGRMDDREKGRKLNRDERRTNIQQIEFHYILRINLFPRKNTIPSKCICLNFDRHIYLT